MTSNRGGWRQVYGEVQRGGSGGHFLLYGIHIRPIHTLPSVWLYVL